MIQVTDAARLLALGLMRGDPTMYAGAKVMLFVNNITPGRGTAIGDLTEPTFPGYARATVTAWTAPYIDSMARASMDSTTVQAFRPTGSPTAAESAYGYALIDTGALNLLHAERFDSPIPIQGTMTEIGIVPRVHGLDWDGGGLVSS